MRTRIFGYHEDPWPDVSFEVRVTDTLGVSGGLPDCRSESHIDVDKGWLHYVELGLANLFYFFLDAAWMFAGEQFEIPGPPRPPRLGGAGCTGAALTPSQDIPLRGGNKAAFRYRRMEVSDGGIFAGGQALLVPREPTVWIVGIAQWAADVDDTTVRARYFLRTDDLRGVLQMIWTADGNVEAPTEAATFVTFDIEGAVVGTVLRKLISVRVADQDGLTAEATREVEIYVQDIADEDVPPACRAKPWLPVCGERFRDEP
ncbi:hypothetical protein BGK72_38125 [Streptomyces agglomeratus]|nr:hypothetical protein BGK72_38125 [Streptomyces agglomeratus]